MKKHWWLGVGVILFGVGEVRAQGLIPPRPYPIFEEMQNYTFVVSEEGVAQVWFQAYINSSEADKMEYKLGLPAGVVGEVSGWYKESGCREESVTMGCIDYTDGVWQEIRVQREGETAVIEIPASELVVKDGRSVNLGMMYKMPVVMNKKWWGREAELVTGKPLSSRMVSVQLGAEFPEGIYLRDKATEFAGWGGISGELAIMKAPRADLAMSYQPGGSETAMLERAGSGQLNKWKENLLQGQDYKWQIMSANATWKLFYQEIGGGVLLILGIALVVSILLMLIVGKKPWWWYLLVMSLLAILLGLVMWLWIGYQVVMGNQNGGIIRTMSLDEGRAVESEPMPPTEEMTPMMQGEE